MKNNWIKRSEERIFEIIANVCIDLREELAARIISGTIDNIVFSSFFKSETKMENFFLGVYLNKFRITVSHNKSNVFFKLKNRTIGISIFDYKSCIDKKIIIKKLTDDLLEVANKVL